MTGRKRTDEELSKIRAEVAQGWEIDEFTCDKCSDRYDCEYAFDMYNTNGDCLANK